LARPWLLAAPANAKRERTSDNSRRGERCRRKIRRDAHHDLAILQHIGDAGRSAHIVFEHVEIVLAGADDIDAGDMNVNIVRNPPANHFRPEFALRDTRSAGCALLNNLLGAIDVGKEQVQAFTLCMRPLEAGPFERNIMRGMISKGINRSVPSPSP